ncbi:hypothetical protein PGIGA_G00174670 [Pangasianodon gigas]|uniref:Uncharacterized protein n=1 Tax=Pangasianodon gigas TaxID=30993 RepID=A0ACC5XUX5_PANGG|nr:hypothetical protein [Pangasianodon gigas]
MIQKNDTVSQVENATAHSSADKTSDDDPELMPVSQAETTEDEYIPSSKKSKPLEDLFGDTFWTVDPSQTVKSPNELAHAEVVKYRDTASLNLGEIFEVSANIVSLAEKIDIISYRDELSDLHPYKIPRCLIGRWIGTLARTNMADELMYRSNGPKRPMRRGIHFFLGVLEQRNRNCVIGQAWPIWESA